MNPMIALRLMDLIALGFTAWTRYQDQLAINQGVATKIGELRQKILTGEMSDEDAAAAIDALIDEMQTKRRNSFNRLPKPE